jgi:hypothetical protein
MPALSDEALGLIAIGATGIARDKRSEWLKGLASRLEREFARRRLYADGDGASGPARSCCASRFTRPGYTKPLNSRGRGSIRPLENPD